MKYYNISLFVVAIVLLLGSNVLTYFGYDEKTFQLLMVVLALIPSLIYRHRWTRNQSQVLLIAFVVLFSMYKLWTDRGEGTRALTLTILGAPVLITAFPLVNRKTLFLKSHFWEKAFKVFIAAYLLEVLTAILERIIGHPIWGWHSLNSNITIQSIGVMEFRCTGMYGHPLYNALMVSTAMAFLLISELKPKIKFALWGIGYIAVLCFNARGSIIGNAILLGVYILSTFFMNRRMADSTKISVFVSGALMIAIAYFLISSGLVGGRLSNLFNDGNAQGRIDSAVFITKVPLQNYLFGLTHKEYKFLLLRNGLNATENFWIDYLLRYGLIFLLCYCVLYFFYLKREFEFYKFFDKFFVTLTFLLIASTNNSLSTSFVALFYFLFLVRLFNPPTFRKIVNKKFRT